MRTKTAIVLLVGMLCYVPFTWAGQSWSLENAWVRAVPPVSKNTAVYFTIKNFSGKDDVLTNVASDVSVNAELHNVTLEPSGAKSMNKVAQIAIKAGQSLSLKPGGYHIMLIGLKKPLQKGEHVSLRLHFQRAGWVLIELPVKMAGWGDEPEKSEGHHHHHH